MSRVLVVYQLRRHPQNPHDKTFSQVFLSTDAVVIAERIYGNMKIHSLQVGAAVPICESSGREDNLVMSKILSPYPNVINLHGKVEVIDRNDRSD